MEDNEINEEEIGEVNEEANNFESDVEEVNEIEVESEVADNE